MFRDEHRPNRTTMKMEYLLFNKKQFNTNYPKGWHLINSASGQSGEFTLCGISFDGDATNSTATATSKTNGRVTCENCKAIIKLCREAKL